MPVRFQKVDEGIYRGGKPSEEDLQILSNVFNINHIISLDGDIGYKISPKVKKLGMKHTIIPIGGEESEALIKFLKNNIVNIIDNNKPVYLHCKHGSDRTGLAVAIYRQNKGWGADRALHEAKRFGFGDKLNPETEKLYSSYLLGDVNESIDGDMVSEMRRNFGYGDVPPAYNPQQSFAPFVGDSTPNILPEESKLSPKDRRKAFRELLMETMIGEQVPSVGGYDNCCGGIRGAGPVENGGGFMNL
jgi:hypothetical protein